MAARRAAILKDDALVQGLGIPIKRRPDDASTYTIPVVRTKPVIEQNHEKSAVLREPVLHEEEYNHILDLISRMALVMERSPRAFYDMDEESIRWQFLVPLNSHYEGMASGETPMPILSMFYGIVIRMYTFPSSILTSSSQCFSYS